MGKWALVVALASLQLICNTQRTFGQCGFTSKSTGGAWTANGTWTGGTAPSSSSPSSNVCIDNNATVTIGAPTFSGSATITVFAGSTLTVSGNLHIGSNITIVVQQGGTLNVTGGFFTDNNGGNPTLTNLGIVSITGLVNVDGAGVITNGSSSNSTASFSVGGDYTITNSGGTHKTDNYGVFNVTGNMSLSNPFNDFVGGVATVGGNVTTISSPSLTVGTNAAGPPYADFIIKGNLAMNGGGTQVTVNKDGRLAVLGSLTHSASGGINLNLSAGSQTYVKDASGFSNSGGDRINSSSTDFYTTTPAPTNAMNGTAQNAVSTVTTQDPTFAAWLASLGVSSILPITLSFFKASTLGESDIKLVWQTESEKNFSYFSLQRSRDGKTFIEIAQVPGHGTTNERHAYQYEDSAPWMGKNYYRLTSVDFDGYQETFPVVEQDYLSSKDFQISPNPTDGSTITSTLNFDEPNGVIAIYDQKGSLLATYNVSTESTISFATPLQNGIYLARYTSSTFTKTVRFMVK